MTWMHFFPKFLGSWKSLLFQECVFVELSKVMITVHAIVSNNFHDLGLFILAWVPDVLTLISKKNEHVFLKLVDGYLVHNWIFHDFFNTILLVVLLFLAFMFPIWWLCYPSHICFSFSHSSLSGLLGCYRCFHLRTWILWDTHTRTLKLLTTIKFLGWVYLSLSSLLLISVNLKC
jgi:hypothetical protein